MSDKQRAAVVGASGYTGEELLRILLRHPNIDLTTVTSRQQAGQPVGRLLGPSVPPTNLLFENLSPEELSTRADVFFLALPHGIAAEFAVPLLKAGKTVLDLSADFRLKSEAKYRDYYKAPHPAPELLKQSVYGLPELYREQLKTAQLIACPGCYPTTSILGLAPALKHRLIRHETIVINAMSGISGAGKKAEMYYSFSERDENVTPYGVPGHRHIPEIEQELSTLAGEAVSISFTPHLVPLVRGMLATTSATLARSVTQEEAQGFYEKFYAGERFVPVLPADQLPETKRVIRNNACEVAVRVDARTNRLFCFSALDNLGKGAAAQAVQAFNVRFGHPEPAGLE